MTATGRVLRRLSDDCRSPIVRSAPLWSMSVLMHIPDTAIADARR